MHNLQSMGGVCHVTVKPCWSRKPSWKMSVITQLTGKGTVETDFSGLYRPPPVFMLAGMCVTWLHSRPMIARSQVVDITSK